MSRGMMRAIAAAGALTGGYLHGTRLREENDRRDKIDARQQKQWDREDAAIEQQDQINRSFSAGAENAGLTAGQVAENNQFAANQIMAGPQMSVPAEPTALESATGAQAPRQSRAPAQGMRHTSAAGDEDRMFAGTKSMYETALKLGRPDLAQAYYGQMSQVREGLLAKANDRAERVYRSTGSISGYIDSYNKYLADGNTIDSFRRNEDGSHVFTLSDGKQSREINVPAEKLDEYLMALRDPRRVAEIEQKRAQVLFENDAKTRAKLNEPVTVGKDQTLVIPGTGQTFSPGGGRGGMSPKEHLSVLKEISDRAHQSLGEYDMQSGKWKPSPASDKAALVAQRIYAGDQSLTPEMALDIARNGKPGDGIFQINGIEQRVPTISYQGRNFVLGSTEAGHPNQAVAMPKPSARPTPADWQGLKVTPEQQAGRDDERRRIIAEELRTTPKGTPGRAALEEEARRIGLKEAEVPRGMKPAAPKKQDVAPDDMANLSRRARQILENRENAKRMREGELAAREIRIAEERARLPEFAKTFRDKNPMGGY